ncbi:MAG: hypothetical protein CL908_15300 [Deltaproteobacteria bacterium]|nr:hypothetical protein [Deltaproteobacteria bacterium]
MLISHEYQFIFIKTVKTAGTSIEVFLSQVCDAGDVVTPISPPVDLHRPRNHAGWFDPIPELVESGGRSFWSTLQDLAARRRFYNHIPARTVRARLPRETWDSYFKFCVERNPWDKAVSHFHMCRHRKAGRYTLDQYFADGRSCRNSPRYTDSQGGILVDRILRYEDLEAELDSVFGMLGVPFDGSLGVRAKSGYRPEGQSYREALSDRQRRDVARIYADEIRLHGYEF